LTAFRGAKLQKRKNKDFTIVIMKL
jgi:hypothetical protein